MSLIALRADASAAIGSGHVRRCLALAAALRARGAHCVLVARDLGLDLAALLAGSGVDWLRLPPPAPGFQPLPGSPGHAAWAGVTAAQDAAETAAALCAGAALQAIVVDHYAFDAGWHRAVREMLGSTQPALRIAAIDDLADRDLAVDLLIDHNHADDHRAKYGARLAADVPLLGGPRHALLAPVYADAPRHQPAAQVHNVGISFGGVDADGHSLVALAALQAAGFAGEVEIVITSACPHREAIEAAAAARPGTRVLCDLPHLAGFYARHGLQIGAGGGATWERCCIGAPTLAVVVAHNQRAVLGPLADLGVLAIAAAPTVDALLPPLRELLGHAELRQALSRQAQALVDGQGAARVAEQLLKL